MSLKSRISQVLARIRKAAEAVQRDPAEIRLLAVSKTKPVAAVREAYAAGQREFGENYLQDALPKIEQTRDLPDICWHFIGPIQSNKTRSIAENFSWVHSIEREKIAKRLNEQRPATLGALQVCIQINISEEANKSGVNPSEVEALAAFIQSCDHLNLRGLMAIPRTTDDEKAQLAAFEKLAAIQSELTSKGYTLDTLSMGMTNDMEAAIRAGSTLVRIGTAIFGARN